MVTRRSGEAPRPPCSATARRRLSTRHTVIHGSSQNTGQTHQWPQASHSAPKSSACTGGSAARPVVPCAAQAPSSARRFFQPELPEASRTILRRHDERRDGVAAVVRDVGLVGPELLLVVGHVAAPVGLDRHERRVGNEPAADPVVDRLVREQEAVGGLVHQDREADHPPAAHQPGEHPADRVAPPGGEDQHADRLEPDPDHVRRVGRVGDPVQLVAELAGRAAVGAEAVGGQGVGERATPGGTWCPAGCGPRSSVPSYRPLDMCRQVCNGRGPALGDGDLRR